MPRFELSIAPNYCRDWTICDALRELFQNAIDEQNTIPGNDMYFSCKHDQLVIGNKCSVLQRSSLLLGETSKTDGSTIGQFGEGYKIAMLILLREGKQVTIYNYGASERWTPRLIKSKRYNSRLLVVDIETYRFTKVPNNDLTIIVEGITEDIYKTFVDNTLHLQNYTCIKLNEREEILTGPNHKGKLFVEGLYVSTDSALEYGYNMNSRSITLNRDRKHLSTFDVRWKTSTMWKQANRPTEVLKLVQANAPDVQYFTSCLGDISDIAAAAHRSFISRYGAEATPVTTQDEADTVDRPIFTSSVEADLIKSAAAYTPPTSSAPAVPSHLQALVNWQTQANIYLPSSLKRELNVILKELLNHG